MKEKLLIEEFEKEPHLAELKIKMRSEFGIELQRRIYSWDNVTRKLEDHYYLENLYEEEGKKLENFHKEKS